MTDLEKVELAARRAVARPRLCYDARVALETLADELLRVMMERPGEDLGLDTP